VPGDPREPVGDEAREWVERRKDHGDFFNCGSLSYLTPNPIGRRFDFSVRAKR